MLKISQNSQDICTVSLLFDKVAGWKRVTLLRRRLRYRCFLVNFAKILRPLFFQNIYRRLLLFIWNSIFALFWKRRYQKKQPPKVFSEKRYSLKFHKFHWKIPVLESVFNKVAGKEETSTQVFSCEICEIFKNTYFEEHLWKTASLPRCFRKKCSWNVWNSFENDCRSSL